MTLRIGPHTLPGRVLLAPMAGITDGPFRALCHQFGAALCCAEMLTSDQNLWNSSKSRQRMLRDNEPGIRAVQLAGADPQTLAEAARAHVALGAQIIDLNMGCPAKKVCNRLCGSALLADEARRRLHELLGEYEVLRRVVEYRETLQQLWEGSSASPTRALAQLREWCSGAEQSGISALREFAQGLPAYARTR